jgi:hypothetical protein
MISPSLIFYVSQALFCIFVLWFPYNWYLNHNKDIQNNACDTQNTNNREIITKIYKTTLVIHKIPIIGKAEHRYTKQGLIIDILCFTRLLCISVLWFPYNWYFMYLKYCFVYRCSSFPIIGILCITSVVLYICVLLSLLLVFYASQALFCISINYREIITQIYKITLVKHKISMMGKS